MKILESPDRQQMSSNHCRQSCSTVWLKKPLQIPHRNCCRESFSWRPKGHGEARHRENTCQWTKTSCKRVGEIMFWQSNCWVKSWELLVEELCPNTTCSWVFSIAFEGIPSIEKTVLLQREILKLHVLLNELFIPCWTTELQEWWESHNSTPARQWTETETKASRWTKDGSSRSRRPKCSSWELAQLQV